MLQLTTPRLRLLALDAASLAAWAFGRAHLERHLGLAVQGWQLEPWVETEIADAMHFWTRNAREHPEQYPWCTTWELVLRERNVSAGGMGFGGPADAEGRVQIGYSLDQRFRGMGLATEALEAMTAWALGHAEVQEVFADTPKDNLPSQGVLLRAGFFLEGETPEGHLRWVKKKSQSV